MELGRVPVKPLFSARLIAAVVVFGVGMALAMAVATTLGLLAGRQEAIGGAEAVTRNLARSLTESVERSVNSMDVTLASVADLALEQGMGSARLDLRAAVAQRLTFTPYLRQILVVRADGALLFDSANQSDGRSFDIGGLLVEHERLPRPLVIGLPVDGRFIGIGIRGGGHKTIPLSRAIRDASGKILGLVIGAVNPDYFVSSFQGIEGESGAHVHLWRFDGLLLAGAGGIDDQHQDRGWDNPLFSRHLKDSEMGTFMGPWGDGVTWITSYRTNLAWPLVVSVGISLDRALEGWTRSVEIIAWPVAAMTLIVLGLTAAMAAMLHKRGRDEARLRLSDMVLSNVSNGVTIADVSGPDMPLIYVNPAFEHITGYAAQNALGRNARFLHEFDPAQEGLDDIRAALAEGRPVTVVVRNQRADGTLFWNQLSLSPLRGTNGALTHWVGVQRDITQQEEARASLAKAYDDVAHYSEDLERFSFVLAHHLQEPARQMRLQAQVLLQRIEDLPEATGAEQPAHLIIDAARRLVDILRDVQAYLAIERQPVVGGIASSETALAAAINRFVDTSKTGPVQVERGLMPRVGIPQKYLDDLFEILIENAVRFRHAERPLCLNVGAQNHPEGWVFQVADNGIGIDPCYHERVFVALERLHSASTYGGTGIGLAIARKITEMAGGRIWVESDGTSGTTVLFTMPQAPGGPV
ncbi:Phytochrome two-component sensor histidine kinase Cyanobacterial phytochrome B [Paramagnetospirillum magnetotacticum MS-1]|uniref:histidine kinase n=1 Tax=Paramagnetospirillum magnetotacticum MS-1 TaxID=272627 RepID=A0A0C2YV27_PARME|nr:sensor histidine kinase [Paramagnetospirillum magnetotacticum]KIL98983.1 Phytochrome two-component sensor histidine kinase Cyanobacterial phytochrome B [Paramagnetospirillum magnetotacticum MS-1]